MSMFSDTSPQPDGRRTARQWLAAMGEDVGLINYHVRQTVDHGEHVNKAFSIAVALKEARRLQSDLYRFAEEVHGIDRDEIDRQGPL